MRFNNCTGTSRNGHRLICRARKVLGQEAAERTLMAFFKRYDKQEVDITRLDLLVRIGVEVGFASTQEVEIVRARETLEWLALLEKIHEDSCVEVRGDRQKDVQACDAQLNGPWILSI
jgi:hypothetical protein